MTETPFQSPLAVLQASRWTQIDFRKPAPNARVEALAWEMEAQIWRLAELQPAALAPQARKMLAGYPGPGRRFIDLFHRPVWSALAWLEDSEELRARAVRAHSLGLFLHLWDDHLCDGQLPANIVTLHMRSLAWREMEEALPREGLPPSLLSAYLEAIQGRGQANSLEAHLQRFASEIAIWRAAPHMLATPLGGRVAAFVDEALTEFCLAWRLVDDVQDLEDDRATGQDNSVRLVMDRASAPRWDAQRGKAPDSIPEDADFGCPEAVEIVLERARQALARASDAAHSAGLPGWADEIAAMGGF